MRYAQPEEKGDNGQTQQEAGQVKGAVAAEDAPPEAVDDTHHGIEAVEEPPFLRDHSAAEADRGDIEPELHHKGDDIAEIPVFDVQGRNPEARSQTGQQGYDDEGRQQEDLPARDKLIIDHHAEQYHEADEKIDERRDERGRRDDHPGKVNLADQAGVVDQAAGGFAQGVREQGPGQHGRKNHQGVGGTAVAGELGDASEDDGEDGHREQRAYNGPENPDDSLLVTDGDIPPGQDQKELAVAPEISPVVFLRAAGFDDKHGFLRI